MFLTRISRSCSRLCSTVYEVKSGAQTQASSTLLPFSYFLKLINFIFVCVGSLLLHGLPLVVASGGYSLAVAGKLLMVVASCVAEHGLCGVGSVAGAHGLCCSAACEMCQDQRSNPCPAPAGGFFTSEPPGKPSLCFYLVVVFKIITIWVKLIHMFSTFSFSVFSTLYSDACYGSICSTLIIT